jgi:WD40 repeat protein
MKHPALYAFLVLAVLVCGPCSSNAQVLGGNFVSGGHKGAVSAVVYDQQRIISAGQDGFLEIWNLPSRLAEERFQITGLPIKTMRLRPGKARHIALLESDGKEHRVSLLNYATKEKIFELNFQTAPSFINYSASGSFLIVAKSDRTGVLCLDADSGGVLYEVPDISGVVAFAATGKSERSIISYMTSGAISYWDLPGGKEIQRLKTVADLKNVILFGNNRFIAGIGAERNTAIEEKGLFVIDAVSGKILDRAPHITQGVLVSMEAESAGFACVSFDYSENTQTVYEFAASNTGKLEVKRSFPLFNLPSNVISMDAAPRSLVFGVEDGTIWLFNQDGSAEMFAVKNGLDIQEIAVAGDALGFLINGALAIIPSDYTLLPEQGIVWEIEENGENEGKKHITSAQNGFILWKEDKSAPLFISEGVSVPLPSGTAFPLRDLSVFNGKVLLLDSVGNITILSLETRKRLFSFSLAGSLDAAFIDDRTIIIGRGDINGATPFLKIDTATGETVPIPYPGSVGIRVYRSISGGVYGAVIGNGKTSLVKLDLAHPSDSIQLAEYMGEDLHFAFAEINGIAASTFGKTRALRYTENGVFPLEQKGGFPHSILDGGRFFISIDKDGVISWINPQTGALLAQFHLYQEEWILERNGYSIGRGLLNYEKDSSELF